MSEYIKSKALNMFEMLAEHNATSSVIAVLTRPMMIGPHLQDVLYAKSFMGPERFSEFLDFLHTASEHTTLIMVITTPGLHAKDMGFATAHVYAGSELRVFLETIRTKQ